MASPVLATRSIREKMRALDRDGLEQLIISVCQEDGEVRHQFSRKLDEMLNPKRLRSPSPNRRNGAESPAAGSPPHTPGSRSRSHTPGEKTRQQLKDKQSPMLSRLPSTLPRVRVQKNGSRAKTTGVAIAAKDMDQLKDMATQKLQLYKDASALYTVDGKLVESLDEVKRDQLLYVSTGEPFVPPDGYKPTTSTPARDIPRTLLTPASLRVKARRNGDPSPDYVWAVVHLPGKYSEQQCFDILLTETCDKLNMTNPAKRIFLETGKEVKSVKDIDRNSTLFFSSGAPFQSVEDAGKPTVTVAKIADDHRLLSKPAKAIMVLKNGDKPIRPTLKSTNGGAVPVDPVGVQIVGTSLESLIQEAGNRLGIHAQMLLSKEGKLIAKFEEIEARELYYVSTGERFIDPEDPMATYSSTRLNPITDDHRLVRKALTRVQAFRNGEDDEREMCIVVVAEPVTFLKELTRKLNLPVAAQRIYDEEGVEVKDYSKLTNMQKIFVAGNEPFKKDKKVTCGVKKIADDHRLTSGKEVKKKIRVWAVRNGYQFIYEPKCVVGSSIEDLLLEAQSTLGLTYPAKRIYDERGRPLTNLTQFTRDMVVHISMGEKWNSGKMAPEGNGTM